MSVSSSHVTVKVTIYQDDKCVYFRVKRDVGIHTIMEAFCHNIGEETSSFVFCFDGIRIKPNQTPNELELEDGDVIDVFGY